MDKTWYRINKADDTAEVMLYDEIGMWGISANAFVRDFNAIDSKNITVRINSVGGSIFDGLAIYEAIKSHKATVNVKVDALAASIASVIAMAGDTITVAKNAFMMIHNGMVMAFGDAADLRKEADTIDKLTNKIAEIYVQRTGKPLAEIKAKMDDETWFDANECMEYGMCDGIGDDDDDDDGESLNMFVKAAEKFAMPQRVLKYAAKLVAKPLIHKEPAMAEKLIQRDGKHFVNVGGKEIEVEVQGNITTPAVAVASEFVSADEIARKAVEKERAYRAEFEAAMTAGGITAAEAVKEFQKFYGRPIEDVKWAASLNIGARAKPVGEGGAADGGKTEADKAAEADKAFEARCAADFAANTESGEPRYRLFGCKNSDPGSDEYKAAFRRFLNIERKWVKDNPPKK